MVNEWFGSAKSVEREGPKMRNNTKVARVPFRNKTSCCFLYGALRMYEDVCDRKQRQRQRQRKPTECREVPSPTTGR